MLLWGSIIESYLYISGGYVRKSVGGFVTSANKQPSSVYRQMRRGR